MPKAVSFAAVLDPALLLKGDRMGDDGQKKNTNTTGEKRNSGGKKREEKASTSRNSSDGQSGQISTNDSTAEEIITRSTNRKGKARARDVDDAALVLDSINQRRASAKLRMALAGESPILQRFGSTPHSLHGPDTSADITESIYDCSKTIERTLSRTISAPSAMPSSTSSSSNRTTSLANSLASEEAQKRKDSEDHTKRQWDDVKRRTLYGSERRKLERQSRRMTRNPKAKMIQNVGETAITSPSELRKKGSSYAPILSQNDLELFKEDVEPVTHSQKSNFSVESDDGVYQTQFSFFHFDSEQTEEDDNQSMQAEMQASTKQTEENISYSESLESSGVQTQTQAAYYADRSASCSNSDTQSSITIHPKSIAPSSPSERDMSSSKSASHEIVHPDPLLDRNTAAEHYKAPEVPTTTLVEQEDFLKNRSEADQKRLRSLCLDEDVDNHKVRQVHPTIWQGEKVVGEYFGPLLNPFVPSQNPPARADLCRWAEWMDSQSDRQLQSSSPAGLYDFQGDIGDWSPE